MKTPLKLQELQKQFAKIITMPFDKESEEHFQVQEQSYDKNFLDLIEGQKNITANERVQFYNRGYWFRLITILQENMPLMRNILGLNLFNELAMAYLEKYPCRSQILNNLADDFLTFINEHHQWNTPLLKQTALLEYAHIKAFDAEHLPYLQADQLTNKQQIELVHKPLSLQPHCFLIKQDYNLVKLLEIVKNCEDNYELELEKPKEKQAHWLICRFQNKVQTYPLHSIQYQLLKCIQQKNSLNETIEKTTPSPSQEDINYFSQNINQWFSDWTNLQILTPIN